VQHLGNERGVVRISYYSADDLERVLDLVLGSVGAISTEQTHVVARARRAAGHNNPLLEIAWIGEKYRETCRIKDC